MEDQEFNKVMEVKWDKEDKWVKWDKEDKWAKWDKEDKWAKWDKGDKEVKVEINKVEAKEEMGKKCVLAAMEAHQIQTQLVYMVMDFLPLDNIIVAKEDLNLLELLVKEITI